MHHRRVPDRDAQHLHVCRAKKPDSLQHCTTTSKQASTQLQLHSVLASVISASDSPDKCTLENVVNQAEETKFLECELKRGKRKTREILENFDNVGRHSDLLNSCSDHACRSRAAQATQPQTVLTMGRDDPPLAQNAAPLPSKMPLPCNVKRVQSVN
jgi:hypothetical protein